MIIKSAAFKYETPFEGPYEIVQLWTSRTITIGTEAITSKINIRRMKPYNNPEVDLQSHVQRI